MKIENREVILDKHKVEIQIAYLDKSDGKEFKRLFDLWRKLNLGLKKYGRGVNIPEVISEGMFCVFSGSVRYVKKVKGIGKVSFDTINTDKSRREQIKATSIEGDVTSFGPKSEWDDLYFVDFFNNGKLDGTFNVYLIPNDLIYSNRVNKGQTMKQQQEEKRRPRMSIKEIIKYNKIKPIAKDVKVW
ncbi:MAG: Bsp6I family restriction endonuclease [Candidatus Magasanikbacteria bacterium CG_4_10_14_0_8_um_filter_32_14]|uniref:Bsp6I family restriction endonuclease n=2 Tax=Candidatus Magasanikiibacteriota TaxID=1752731 RepID=A0A2M7R8N5_9BACT|nr:MAG: hypothetical protein AUJ23_03475 [Candidatus Magasanikbacteria bacterium CG1_02_32_51]PIY93110.1 MAG: Bsp6I family restriction endonuclease [Candidatus Magasanikbacteria bacterium CG_4_10_14_0_8_um_filter_32_14]